MYSKSRYLIVRRAPIYIRAHLPIREWSIQWYVQSARHTKHNKMTTPTAPVWLGRKFRMTTSDNFEEFLRAKGMIQKSFADP